MTRGRGIWMRRVGSALHWLSDRLTGVGAVALVIFLGVLGAFGTLSDLGELLGLRVGTYVLVALGVIVLVGNWTYRLDRRAKAAELARDEALSELRSKPDPGAIIRSFIRLHDEGPQIVRDYFQVSVERLRDTIPVGEQRYADWIARCTLAITTERPAYALRFRQSQEIMDGRRYSPVLVVLEGDGGQKQYVNMSEASRYQDLIAQSVNVLAEIINDG